MNRYALYAAGAAVLVGITTFAGLHFSLFAAADDAQDTWPVMGQGISNSRNQESEQHINKSNVNQLSTKWTFSASDDVSATPTVDGDAVYFPDWGGNLYAVDRNTGALKWSHQISEYDGFQGAFSRVSPALHGGGIQFVEPDGLDLHRRPHRNHVE
jgi:polyvinyl alcohol dehydrogenase (cytochrome)